MCIGLFYQICHCVPARIGLMHIGVFILLLLSGERHFGKFYVCCVFLIYFGLSFLILISDLNAIFASLPRGDTVYFELR